MDWLSDNLRSDIRLVFEHRYHRKLSNSEVSDIASNLTYFIEHMLQFYEAIQYENTKK